MKIVKTDLAWDILCLCGTRRDLHQTALQSGFRVSMMSETLGCSERHVYDVFMRDVGLPPKQWLVQVRMCEARQRLQAGEDPKQLVDKLGFSSLGTFRREFVRCYGVGPSQYLQDRDRRGAG